MATELQTEVREHRQPVGGRGRFPGVRRRTSSRSYAGVAVRRGTVPVLT